MAFTTKAHVPLVSSTKFDVSPVSVGDETGYTGLVGAGTGRGILGSSMPKGRALLIQAACGAVANSPTGLTFGLAVADDENCTTNLAFVSGATTEVTPAAGGQYSVEVPLSYVSNTAKYYCVAVALKGGGTATALLGTVSNVLDPTYP